MSDERPPATPSPRPNRRASLRAAVQETLVAEDGFRSAHEVFVAMRAHGHEIGLSTVYRHLQSLTERGLVDVIRNIEGEATYHYRGELPTGRHHHHLVCRRCGRAEEIGSEVVERWADRVAQDLGYVGVEHTIEFHGTCHDCADGPVAT